MLRLTGAGLTATTTRGLRPDASDSGVSSPDAAASWMLDKRTDRPFEPLIRTIEGEIIPRLLLAHKGVGTLSTDHAHAGLLPTAEHVIEFTSLVLSHDAAAACGYMEAMLDQGYLIETLYLDLLAPAARHLGVQWEQDLCDFVEVTMALGRLQHVIREFSAVFRDSDIDGDRDPQACRRVLLTPAPGEQHSLGLMMVKEFFIRSGWDVQGGPGMVHQEVCPLVSAEWFDSVGVSVGIDGHLDGLATWLRNIRSASRNPELVILVGGPKFAENPELAAAVGADGTAIDARGAVEQAGIKVSQRQRR